MMTDNRNRVDAEHFGCFVAQLRRNQGLTQKQVADKLCVSNKAVSKWECGGSMPGMSFNNRNWPQIARAGRAYCFLIPVLWPVVYFLLRLVLPAIVWYILRLPVLLFIVLGGLFIPMYVMGKKYE